MNYSKIYFKIINSARNRKLHGYSEKHHVVPKCLTGADLPSNIVELTPEEHFLCHQLLVKMFPKNIKLVYAISYMSGGINQKKINNKLFGWCRRKISDNWKGDNNPQRINPRSGARHHFFGKKLPPYLTESGRKILSEKMKKDNPFKGKPPWLLNSTTDETRYLWKKADFIYNLWIEDNSISYGVLFKKFFGIKYNQKTCKGKPIGTFMSMIKKFRSGWIPNIDNEWKSFVKEI